MSHPSTALSYWKWLLLLISPGLFFAAWITFVKPYEAKRLKVEATQTADRLISAFSTHSMENLDSIEQIFSHIERVPNEERSIFINNLNAYFERIHGLESFILPSAGTDDGALVLFNPYVMYPQALSAKEACTQALLQYPEQLTTYKNMSVLPLDNALCVYSPLLHTYAVLNLKTTLDEHLQQESMKGYFLALLEEQLPELIANSELAWVHSRIFSFLGTEWKIHVYPSGAYVEASMRRVFRVFGTSVLGCLGLLGWWSLRRRVNAHILDPHYIAHLKQLALFDGVTNLPNRRYLMEHLETVLKRATREKTHFSVCFMDCDGFKTINDSYGHPVGDLVLRHIAGEVSQVIRKNDFFARFSGDEFCLILEGVASEEALKITLDKILQAIARPVEVGDKYISVTMSVGVAIYPSAGDSVEALLKHADEAMYITKRYQKNTYSIYQG